MNLLLLRERRRYIKESIVFVSVSNRKVNNLFLEMQHHYHETFERFIIACA